MTFEEYLDQVSHTECGKPVKRMDAWSISLIHFARQLWHDAIELNREVVTFNNDLPIPPSKKSW